MDGKDCKSQIKKLEKWWGKWKGKRKIFSHEKWGQEDLWNYIWGHKESSAPNKNKLLVSRDVKRTIQDGFPFYAWGKARRFSHIYAVCDDSEVPLYQ